MSRRRRSIGGDSDADCERLQRRNVWVCNYVSFAILMSSSRSDSLRRSATFTHLNARFFETLGCLHRFGPEQTSSNVLEQPEVQLVRMILICNNYTCWNKLEETSVLAPPPTVQLLQEPPLPRRSAHLHFDLLFCQKKKKCPNQTPSPLLQQLHVEKIQ